MQLSEMQTAVNRRRRDDTSSFISTDEIKDYLNEGNRKVQAEREWQWATVSATFGFSQGSYQYALSSIGADFREPIDVYYTNDYEFERVKPSDFRRLSGGSYNMFAIEGDYIFIDTSFGSATLTIPYYSHYSAKTSGSSIIKALSSGTDEPLMPERFQDMLVEYADAMCQRKEGNLDDYNIAMREYDRFLTLMKREYPSDRKLPARRWKNITETNVNTIGDRKEIF